MSSGMCFACRPWDPELENSRSRVLCLSRWQTDFLEYSRVETTLLRWKRDFLEYSRVQRPLCWNYCVPHSWHVPSKDLYRLIF